MADKNQTMIDTLMQTWPARMAQDAWSAAKLPGDVYQGNVNMYGPDGHTNPEVINRAADLAGMVTLGAGAVPGSANELRAGIRPYQNVPDNLMGYSKNGPQKPFGHQGYSFEQPVQVVFPDKTIMQDSMMGLNADHALERAYRNWPTAIHIQNDPMVQALLKGGGT